MNTIEKATIIQYHRRRLGQAPLTELGWRSLASQQKRFEVLCQIGDLNHCKILDLGCGHGDLKPFLDQRFKQFSYLGVDQLPEFIQLAQSRHAHLADTGFVQADFLNAIFPQVDYVLASGAMSYRTNNLLFPFNLIEQMWAAANRGLAFNLLNAHHFEADAVLCGQDPQLILQFCQQLCPSTQLLDDYLEDDFTIFMRRE